jgi:hypothetical protein
MQTSMCFQDMMELSAPRAIHLVQDKTGKGSRDQDVEMKELPTHFTKRGTCHRHGLDGEHKIDLNAHKGKLSGCSFVAHWISHSTRCFCDESVGGDNVALSTSTSPGCFVSFHAWQESESFSRQHFSMGKRKGMDF